MPVIMLLPLAATACYFDLRYRRIPNWLTVLGVVAGLAVNAAGGRLWFAVAGMVVGFLVLLVPYLFGGVGAGDVKLLAAFGSMIGPSVLRGTLIGVILGGVGALWLIACEGKLMSLARDTLAFFAGGGVPRPHVRSTLPYAVFLSAGVIIGGLVR
ncbi:MAG: A24 family peptidase [Bacillota bacterium]